MQKIYNAYRTENFSSDDFRLARDSWRNNLCGDKTTNDTSIPGIENILLMYDLDSEQFRKDMNREKGTPILFGDEPPVTSGELKIQYDAIYRMALPYGTVGCRSYKSRELACDVLYALDWMYENMYGENVLTDTSFRSWKLYDWWDWFIGGACPMMNTLMIIEDAITPELIKKYTTPISYLRYQMKTDPTPAHMMSRMMSLTPLALLTEDRELLKKLYEECEVLLDTHDSGENMRRDHACMTHGLIYNIAYGFINLDRIGRIIKILSPTPLAYPVSQKKHYSLMNMIRYTFAPSMYNGRPFAPMNGRKMQDFESLLTPLKYFIYAYGVYTEAEDREIKTIIRRNATPLNRELLISHFDKGVTLEEYRRINSGGDRSRYEPITQISSYAMLYDALTNPEYDSEPYTLGYMWYSGDTAVQFRHGSMVGVRMCSSRAPSYECINGVNADGWYTGEGAVYLYTENAPAEYTPRWWRSADKHLIPGTTVDDRVREPMNIEHAYKNNQSFVGGVALDGEYVTMTMDHEAFHNEVEGRKEDNGHGRGLPIHHSTLTSKKSYFMLDRAVVCIGCDVRANDGFAVRTVIDNRLIEDGDEIFVNGEKFDFTPGDVTRDDVKAIHFGRGGAYLFESGQRITLRCYEKEGERRIAAWIDHGKNPDGESYSYVILPGKDPGELISYDASDIEILRNDSEIQAVREVHSGLLGIIFRKAAEFEGIKADQPMIVMMRREKDGKAVSLAIADPTQLLEGYSLSLRSSALLESDDCCVSISREADVCRVKIECDSARGRTYVIHGK